MRSRPGSSDVVSAARYTSPVHARLEAERLWPRVWLCAAHASQLASHGDFVALTVVRDPIVIVRDGGRIRAFHDVCRHRGARITATPSGRCARLRCRYHGWEYSLDGTLHAAPSAISSQVAPERPALAPVACEVRHSLVWIALEPERAGTIDAWLAPAEALLATSPCASVELHHVIRTEVPCNWKVSSDVHNEAYHLSTLHPELDGVIELDRVELEGLEMHTHFRIPLRVDGREQTKHQLYVFPNVQVNWTEGGPGIEIYRHWPHESDPERAYFEEIRLGPVGGTDRPFDSRIETVRFGERSLGAVLDADLAMLPSLQQGLRSRAAPPPRLHRLEAPIAHMHHQIDRLLEIP